MTAVFRAVSDDGCMFQLRLMTAVFRAVSDDGCVSGCV